MGIETFIAGIAYGTTSVIVGQPLDTIKTRMQASSSNISSVAVAREIFVKEGIFGLYRGGLPLLIGGALIRSAQFGVYNNSLSYIRNTYGATNPEEKWFKFIDPQVVASGFLGGLGRGAVETPFEFLKTRRQVDKKWHFREVMSGSGTTLLRNSFLFGSFAIYMDISKQVVEGGLSPFWTGAICANLAWLTIWPLDVVKTQVQSGNQQGSIWQLLKSNFRNGAFLRGLLPGLARSFISNGCSMVVYTHVLNFLQKDER
jgi:solute carrier family 25 carnitine/acylcarnitine transporter 20/29